jgi:hypothetical protein
MYKITVKTVAFSVSGVIQNIVCLHTKARVKDKFVTVCN